jgi:hypothetical protein
MLFQLISKQLCDFSWSVNIVVEISFTLAFWQKVTHCIRPGNHLRLSLDVRLPFFIHKLLKEMDFGVKRIK